MYDEKYCFEEIYPFVQKSCKSNSSRKSGLPGSETYHYPVADSSSKINYARKGRWKKRMPSIHMHDSYLCGPCFRFPPPPRRSHMSAMGTSNKFEIYGILGGTFGLLRTSVVDKAPALPACAVERSELRSAFMKRMTSAVNH